MIITDQFVFIHDPKTGGSFVTSVLFDLYEIHWNNCYQVLNILLGYTKYNTLYGTFILDNKKHFGCKYIPSEYRDRIILATVRNPYDWYTSQYEFGWWKKKSMVKFYKNTSDFEKKYPHFPNISFAEFLELSHVAFENHFECDSTVWQKMGWRSRLFLQNFSLNPTKVLTDTVLNESIDIKYLKSQLYNPIHFIHTQSLNRELFEFLLSIGFPKSKLEFILEKQKVLPYNKKRTENMIWEKYYTPELKAWVRRKDDLMFSYFPIFDV